MAICQIRWALNPAIIRASPDEAAKSVGSWVGTVLYDSNIFDVMAVNGRNIQ